MAKTLNFEYGVVKRLLEADGIDMAEDNINQFGQEALTEFNMELAGNFFAAADFPLTDDVLLTPYFEDAQAIIHQLIRGKFWLESNSDASIYDKARGRLVAFKASLKNTIPTTISD